MELELKQLSAVPAQCVQEGQAGTGAALEKSTQLILVRVSHIGTQSAASSNPGGNLNCLQQGVSLEMFFWYQGWLSGALPSMRRDRHRWKG